MKMTKERKLTLTANVLSIVVPLLVAILLGMNGKNDKLDFGSWTKSLPHLIGLINTFTSLTLISALVAVKKKKFQLHTRFMYASVVLGALFLLTYVTYHVTNTSTSFGGEGVVRVIYLTLLISHIVLSIVVVWFVLMAMKHALLGDFIKHKKIVKIAFPLWLYVSVTGVIVYLMISPYYV